MNHNPNTPFGVLVREAKAGSRVLLVGPPATGKTARVRALARELGYEFFCTALHLQERPDLSGVIVPDKKLGVARQLPLEMLARLRNADHPVLWLIDDLGKAPIDVQGALKSLITRSGEGMSLPPNVLVWGATNRPEDGAGVRGLDESLRSEFDAAYEIPAPIHQPGNDSPSMPDELERGTVFLSTWQAEVEQWTEYAFGVASDCESDGRSEDAEWVASIAAFHANSSGTWLYRWTRTQNPATRYPDYRSWGAVIALPSHARSLRFVAARIGHGAASAFMAFREVINKVPSRDQVEMFPDSAPVPEERDGSALYYIATLLPIWLRAGFSGKSNVRQIVTYMERLPRQFAAYSAKLAISKHASRLLTSKYWTEYMDRNKDLFIESFAS